MINYHFFSTSEEISDKLVQVISCFKYVEEKIDSETHKHKSDSVLAILRPKLLQIGFQVEHGKKADGLIKIPVLFTPDGQVAKYFFVDALHEQQRIVVEVEAGRGVENNQFLKDIFQACMMPEIDYLVIAVRNQYRKSKHFHIVSKYLETLYASKRLQLPLKGILLIGY